MQNNRPYFGKKVLVILPVNNLSIWFTLPAWMCQDYENMQIILDSATPGMYRKIQNLAERLQWTYGETAESDIVVPSLLPIEEWIKRIRADVVIRAGINSMPAPFFVGIATMAIDHNSSAICEDIKVFPSHLDQTDTTVKLSPSCVHPTSNIESKLVTVFIPCMDRANDLLHCLPYWFNQHYPKIKVCVIDYSSSEPIRDSVYSVCQKYNKTYSDDPAIESDVLVLRIDNMKHFNISHAYNYAISRVKTDIIATVCADSEPWDYYIDAAVSCLTNDRLVQIHWGLHTITYENWKRLNGHQEFIVGWGAEDDDFRLRANILGLDDVILPSKIVYQLPTDNLVKSKNRKIKDVSESSLINHARFTAYIASNGCVGNYNGEIGGAVPVDYIKNANEKNILRLWCFREQPNKPSENIVYNADFKMYYWIGTSEWNPQEYGINKYEHFYIDNAAQVDKYLSVAQKNV